MVSFFIITFTQNQRKNLQSPDNILSPDNKLSYLGDKVKVKKRVKKLILKCCVNKNHKIVPNIINQ